MIGTDVVTSSEISARRSRQLVGSAVHRNGIFSKAGLTERTFTLAFSSLVYPQIWEDPVVDMEAMALAPGHRIVTIASGGCNILSYLTAAPVEIVAVDLNTAHLALNRLKCAALTHLPDHAAFYRFFGGAESRENVAAYDDLIRPHLDEDTEAYWSGRDVTGRRRIDRFARGFYRHGLLGRFIATGHLLARLFGSDPLKIAGAKSIDEQRLIFDRELKPLFAKPLIRHLLGHRSSLFGLGIPPAQYDALAEGRPMHEVIEERLARLAYGFALSDNYFAWQAFNRGYAPDGKGPLPPYLQKQNFEVVRQRVDSVEISNISFTQKLAVMSERSADRYILLDAQDWMSDAELTALWRQISRTSRPGARVIFRTAGTRTILPGRVQEDVLGQWIYQEESSREFTRRDRSAIYGAFHLYIRAG